MDPFDVDCSDTEHHHDDVDGDGPTTNSSSSGKKSNSAAYEMIPLEPDFEPTELDVICARGKEAYNHPGNIRFRALVQDQLHNYQSSTSKMAKSHIVREIIESVRNASPKGGFVKKVGGKWWDVGERARREKTGQQIRDLLHDQYRSSTKSKARTRKRLRKSHSENSASKVNTQAAIASVMAGRTGPLPPRIVTLDAESSPTSSAAAARAAIQTSRQAPFRRNSESDLQSAAYRDREHDTSVFSSFEPSEATYDGMRRLREADASFSNPMNCMMPMNTNMNMSQPSMMMGMGMNAAMGLNMGMSNMGMNMNMGLGSQGWGSMSGVNTDTCSSGYMSQTSQLNRFPSMMMQQQPSAVEQHNSYAGVSSQFDRQTPNLMGMNNMPYQTAAFNNAVNTSLMMQGQANPTQAYISNNTRPYDPNYDNELLFHRSRRVARPMPSNESEPLFHPIDSGFQDRSSCQPQQNCVEEEEPHQSFEEAIDNIYTVDTTPKRI